MEQGEDRSTSESWGSAGASSTGRSTALSPRPQRRMLSNRESVSFASSYKLLLGMQMGRAGGHKRHGGRRMISRQAAFHPATQPTR